MSKQKKPTIDGTADNSIEWLDFYPDETFYDAFDNGKCAICGRFMIGEVKTRGGKCIGVTRNFSILKCEKCKMVYDQSKYQESMHDG